MMGCIKRMYCWDCGKVGEEEDVLDGQPGISTIHRNLIAEFKNGKVESHHLLLSAMTAAKFAPQMVAHDVVLTTRGATSSDHKLIWHFLAACRRQLCRADPSDGTYHEVFRLAYICMQYV